MAYIFLDESGDLGFSKKSSRWFLFTIAIAPDYRALERVIKDETGDHGLSFVDENFPIFLLVGCLFNKNSYADLKIKIEDFKKEFFKTKEIILHSRDIRKCGGAFQILFDLDIKKRFYEKLNEIISSAKFTIIPVGIDKKQYIEKYGKIGEDPYIISLSYLMEELILKTNHEQNSEISIFVEKRGKNEDKKLLSHYNNILDVGTLNTKSELFKSKINSFDLILKRDNNIGIQIADLCAYPIARHVLNSEEPYIPFEIIRDKIIQKDVKMFP